MVLPSPPLSLFVLFELLPTGFSSMYDVLLPHGMNGLMILCFYCKDIIGKVREVGMSQVFSLRHQVDDIFKTSQ